MLDNDDIIKYDWGKVELKWSDDNTELEEGQVRFRYLNGDSIPISEFLDNTNCPKEIILWAQIESFAYALWEDWDEIKEYAKAKFTTEHRPLF